MAQTIEVRGGQGDWPESDEMVEMNLLAASRQRQDEILGEIGGLMSENRERTLALLREEGVTQRDLIRGEVEAGLMEFSRGEQEKILGQLEMERIAQERFLQAAEAGNVWEEHDRWVRETDALMLSRKRQDAILQSLRKRKRRKR